MTNATETQATIALPKAGAPPPAPVPRTAPRGTEVGLSLRWKIFGAVLLLVVAVIATIVAVIQVKATAFARTAIDKSMDRTATVWSALEEESFRKLAAAAGQLADDPNTKAALGTADAGTVFDYVASKRAEALPSADSIMVLDRDGILVARSDDRAKVGIPMADKSPLFAKPLQGEAARGWAAKGEGLVRIVSAPIVEGEGTIAGALVVSEGLSAEESGRIRDALNAEATFLLWNDKGPALAQTSLSREEAKALVAAFTMKPELSGPAAADGKAIGPLELSVGGDPTVLLSIPLVSASGQRLGVVVASRSLFQEMAGFRQLRNTILAVGGASALFALLLSLLLASRITGPVRALAAAVDRVKDGELDVEIPPAASDEIGLLSRAFAKMVVELRQKAEMEEYLRSLGTTGGAATAAMAAGRMTLAGASPIGSESATSVMPAGSGSTLQVGGTFANRYEIDQVLGAGAMGMVYHAKDRELDEEVAIKTIRPESMVGDPQAVDRFKQEIRLARKITNKHVLRTYDFGDADGVRFITMEYVKSVTLKYLLEQKKALPLGPGLHLAKQMCDGLAAAHEQGVVHRDIKPQNMLVTQKGELKLMDFGISTLQNAKSDMTQEGMVIGTPDYMSPEQAQGRALDHRSDIYSTGVVLYELFCGRLPFRADSVIALVMKQVQENPEPPRKVNPALPVEVEKIILRAMEKDPAKRYPTISALYDDLSNVAG